MKVVIVDTISGSNDYTSELVRALAEHQKPVVVTVENTKMSAEWCARFYPLMPAFGVAAPVFGRVYKQLRAYLAIVREAFANRECVIHIQFFRFSVLESVLYLFLRFSGCKLVYTAHNVLPHAKKSWHSGFYRWWYRQVDRIHVLSQTVRSELISELGVRSDMIRTVQHGLYTLLKERYGEPKDGVGVLRSDFRAGVFKFGMIGIIRPYKGVERIIEAVRLIPEDAPIHIIVAGGGDEAYAMKLATMVKDAGRAHLMEIRSGHLSDADMCELIMAADALLYPYLNISQSGALCLGLTFGKSCICSDIDGFRELLTDQKSGLLVDTADPEAFSRAMLRLASDAALREELQCGVRILTENAINWRTLANQMRGVYADVFDGKVASS